MTTKKHGMTNSVEYHCWASMIARCENANDPRYEDYGGRGITVFPGWHDFVTFIEDMGRKPGPDFSIDRINNNEGYYPYNCRWATRSQQQQNKRSAKNKLGFPGVFKIREKFGAKIKVDGKQLHLGVFVTAEEAGDAYAKAKQKLHKS